MSSTTSMPKESIHDRHAMNNGDDASRSTKRRKVADEYDVPSSSATHPQYTDRSTAAQHATAEDDYRPTLPNDDNNHTAHVESSNNSILLNGIQNGSVTAQQQREDTTDLLTTTLPIPTSVATTTSTSTTVQPTVASHYNAIVQKTVAERKFSPIIGLKSYNNWVKSVLIKHYGIPAFSRQQHHHQHHQQHQQQQQGAVVLDLCCGKGGDLLKFRNSNISYYVGADHAYQSLIDALERYNNRPPYPALFITSDLHRTLLSSILPTEIQFDCVSVQFALHYSFESSTTAHTFMRNIADRLVDNGIVIMTYPDANRLVHKLRQQPADIYSYGNDVYHVEFDTSTFAAATKQFYSNKVYGNQYIFNLSDAIDNCPEYLVHQPTLNHLCRQHDLYLLHEWNLHEFFAAHYNIPEYRELAQRMKVVSSQQQNVAGVTPHEWEAIGLYKAVVYQKRMNRNDKNSTINDGRAATNSSTGTSGTQSGSTSTGLLPPRRQHYPHFKQLQPLAIEDICICLSEGKDKCKSTHNPVASSHSLPSHHGGYGQSRTQHREFQHQHQHRGGYAQGQKHRY